VSPWSRRTFHASLLLASLTGLAYGWTRCFGERSGPFGPEPHPWTSPLQHAHVLAAPLLVFALGVMAQGHVAPRLRSGCPSGRRTGWMLLGLATPMVFAGYGIQVAMDPLLRTVLAWVHGISALAFLLGFLAHLPRLRSLRTPGFRVPALLLVLLAGTTLRSETVDREVRAMGTVLRLHLEGPPEAAEAALGEVARIEAACSTWDPDSAWSRLNAAGGHPQSLDREWLELLGTAQAWSQRTGGSFDPVLMALLRAWGTRDGGRVPGKDEWFRARRASGRELLELDPAAGTARLRDPGAGVEEGAFVKGYALEAARRRALAAGALEGWMDFGGQVIAWGRPLPTDVADPRRRSRPRLRLVLDRASLSVSGCSERGRHLLDPRTGRPCRAYGEAVAVAPSALDADILSTALYVMGPRKGLPWARRNGVAAAWILADGRLLASPAFRALGPR
jgi:FAD:protein FMN transferase